VEALSSTKTADVIAKLAIDEKEADESFYWLEMLIDTGILPVARLSQLIAEIDQIVAMTVVSQKTLRNRHPKCNIPNPRSEIRR
jgi:four helix bundle protein